MIRSFVTLLVLSFSLSASAGETAAAPTTPASASIAARDAYKASLNAALDKNSADSGAFDTCALAKESYVNANKELARIAAELAVPTDIALGQLQTDNRAKFEALKKSEEAKLAKAKADAKVAGVKLAAENAQIYAIETEIKRIEAAEKREREVARPASNSGLGTRSADFGIGSFTSIGSTETKPVASLPAEFKGCFPDEVTTTP